MPEDITEVFTKIYGSLGNIAGLNILPVLDFEGFTKEQTKGIFEFIGSKGLPGYILLYNESYFTGIPEEPEIPDDPAAPSAPSVPVIPSVPETPSVPESSEEPEEPSDEESSESSKNEDDSPGITIVDGLG